MIKNKIYRLFRYILCLTLFFTVLSGQFNARSQADTTSNADANVGGPALSLQSEAAVLIDGDTGQILFDKNMRKQMYPASITKIMTALIALENGSPDDIITMSHDAVYSIILEYGSDASSIALDEGEMLTLEDALYAAAIESANDACNGIAELIGGNIENFVELMNRRAKELGTLNTHFDNPHGLPDPNHYTSPYDMALITMAAIKIPEFVKLFSAMDYEMLPTNKQPESRFFHRTNSMFKEPNLYDGIMIEKTGWTSDAGHTYVIAAKRNGRTLIAVIMKSPDNAAKFADVNGLLDFGFNELIPVSYKTEEFAKEHYIVKDANGKNTDMNLAPAGEFDCLISKSLSKNDIDITYIFPENAEQTGAKAVFSLKPEAQSFMYSDLGEAPLTITFNNSSGGNTKNIPAADSVSVAPEAGKKSSVFSTFYKIISVVLQILGFLFVILIVLYIQRYMSIQKKRRTKSQNKNININNTNKRR